MIDYKQIRADFPIFKHHPDLVYLDNASTTQKPKLVIDGITNFYEKENANINRGLYKIATQTSANYQDVRLKTARFIGSADHKNIVFSNGTTEAINLVAYSFLEPRLEAGDNVIISAMEHHANRIPWQMLCRRKGAELRVIPMNRSGQLDLAAFKQILSKKTKMVAVVQVSNSLGTINPVEEIIDSAHKYQVPVLIDGAQSVLHHPVNVSELGCDFFVFSGHKLFGPTGVGALYGKETWLAQMNPFIFGGDMIKEVSFETTVFADAPQKFEAGTRNLAGVIGLGYAIDYLNNFDKKEISGYLEMLGQYAFEQLSAINGLKIFGNPDRNSNIISFNLENIHPHDVATFLAEENIALRAGHHCTQPVMDFFGIPGTTRASFTMYNSTEEVDRLVKTLKEIQKFFA